MFLGSPIPSNADQEIVCEFADFFGRYSCGINDFEITDPLAAVRITGDHLPGRTNQNVIVLNIMRSNLSHFPNEFFRAFPNLEMVQISLGTFKTLNKFENCESLRELNIGSAELEFLPDNALTDCRYLQDVYFINNKIKNFDPRGFEHIERLYLSMNQLGNNLNFKGMVNLINLILDNNGITELTGHEFDGLLSLEFLGMAQNEISYIHPSTFQGLPSLWTINLGFNRITDISDGVFSSIRNLETIFLHDNQLTQLRSNIFEYSYNIQNLFFRNNLIEVIEKGVFDRLHNLQKVQFSDNKCINEDFSIWPPGQLSQILPSLEQCLPRD